MKTIFAFFCLQVFSPVFAQNADELLVYSLKGNVTLIENNNESRLKIGKVLKPGTAVKTQRASQLTMVCKQGKPISVTKEGTYPVVRWKDSCVTTSQSVASKYFQYIWDQMYVRSDEYKRKNPDGIGAVVRNEAPVRGEDDMEILFAEDLDTINYATGSFPLSWSVNFKRPGNYHFMLFSLKGGKPIYEDSIAGNSIQLEKLKRNMKAGNSYGWSVGTKKSGVQNGGIINFLPLKKVKQHITQLQKAMDVPEDQGAQNFRVAYLLQDSQYPADAFIYYQKAVNAAPDVDFYKEKLDEFKNVFRIN